jgi:hypothetical protein
MDCDTVHQARVRTPPGGQTPRARRLAVFGAQVPVVDDAKTAAVVHGRARLPAVPERQRRAGMEVSRVNARAVPPPDFSDLGWRRVRVPDVSGIPVD